MFRKPANVKSEQKLSDKDAKKLQADAVRLLGISAEDAGKLLPRKPGLSVQKCGGGLSAVIYTSEGCAVAFECGAGDALVPSLPSLWRMPPGTFPTLFVPEETAPFLVGGSDLMLPGVHGLLLPDAGQPLVPGTVACVAALGNSAPFAVGMLLVGRAELDAQLAAPGGVKGRCLQLLHVFGDTLWLASGAPLPNRGFVVTETGKEVHPCSVEGEEEAAAIVGPAFGDAPAADGGATEASGEGGGGGGDGALAAAADAAYQDQLLEQCFLQAARSVGDKLLPMALNTFYANHMRPGDHVFLALLLLPVSRSARVPMYNVYRRHTTSLNPYVNMSARGHFSGREGVIAPQADYLHALRRGERRDTVKKYHKIRI
ncbi:hypothetical protein T492DRAFT_848343 [Pavlovales sp. CCMP2436]|nr:hypothetical protein T492DRAFT_848343 [Pavlovales sp. CCMP2436]